MVLSKAEHKQPPVRIIHFGHFVNAARLSTECRLLECFSHRDLLRRVLIGAEAQQCGHAPGLFQGWIALNKLNFRAIAQCQVHESVGNITDLMGFLAADGASADYARVQMPAVCALNRFSLKIATDQQNLHLLALQCIQHMAQAQSTARIALRLACDFANESLFVRCEKLVEYTQCVFAHFLS